MTTDDDTGPEHKPARSSIADRLVTLGLQAFGLGVDSRSRPCAVHHGTGGIFALWGKPGLQRFADQLLEDYRAEHGVTPDPRHLPRPLRLLISTATRGEVLTVVGDGEPKRSEAEDDLVLFGIDAGRTSEVRGVREVVDRLSGRVDIWHSAGTLNRAVRDEHGRVVIRPIADAAELGNWCEMQERIPFYVTNEDTGAVSEVFCPGAWATRVLRRGEFPGVKPIMGTSQIPVVRPDGSVASVDGYDEVSGWFLDLDPDLRGLSIPEDPTEAQLRAARNRFVDLLSGFPFGNQGDDQPRRDASMANAFGLLLTVSLKGMHPSMAVPCHAVSAGARGSGKSLIALFLPALLAGDRNPGSVTWPTDDAEMRKRLTSEFAYGRRLLAFDNVPEFGVADSAPLAQLLTATHWSDRILGGNVMLNRPNDKIATLNGNNLKLGADLVARSVPIIVDPATDRPEQRTFSVRLDSAEALAEMRPTLVTAALTILVGWARAGCPDARNPPVMRQFSSWARRVGGVLEFLGVEHHLANMDEFAASDPAEEGLIFLWSRVAEHFPPPRTFTAAEVTGLLEQNPVWDESLPAFLAERVDRGSFAGFNAARVRQSIGTTFRAHKRTYHGGVRIARASENAHGSTTWLVQPLGEGSR